MADGVHPVMQAVKVSGRDAPSDRAVAQPELAELPSADDTVLAGGEPRNQPIHVGWAAIWPHSDHFAARGRHRRSMAQRALHGTPGLHQQCGERTAALALDPLDAAVRERFEKR
jgi:hypothetical protein